MVRPALGAGFAIATVLTTPAPLDSDAQRRAKDTAHVLHEVHLGAEGLEAASHAAHGAVDHVERLEAARTLAAAHANRASALRRQQREIGSLERAVAGGDARARGHLDKKRATFEATRQVHEQQRPLAAEAHDRLARHAHGESAGRARLGETAIKIEQALASSPAGGALSAAAKTVASAEVVRGLMVAGAAAEGYAGYVDAPSERPAGKAANAALATGAGAAVMASPWVAGADILAPRSFKLSELLRGGAAGMAAIGEGLATGDTRALKAFIARSDRGEYGELMRASTRAGEYWAEHGVAGGLRKARAAADD